MKAGDVITAIDGKAVKSPGELVDQLAGKQGEVTISVTRDKKALTLKATLRRAGDAAAAGDHRRPSGVRGRGLLVSARALELILVVGEQDVEVVSYL